MFAYGAQYYRPPNPPADDWADDFQRMSDAGFNTVKLWAMWNHTHPTENEYDFLELDELVDLATKHDLQVVISLILENAPHWLAERYPGARYEDQNGQKVNIRARPNTPGGGWPGLCLNHEPVRKHAQEYMHALGSRYADDETVAHYTTWDEAFFEPNNHFPHKRFCYCEECDTAFREWLGEKYGDLEGLCEAWEQRLTAWSQAKSPRYHGGYPRFLDWLRFRLDNHRELMQWRAAALNDADPTATLRAHGIAGNLGGLVEAFNDDWESATTVEKWGATTFPHFGPDHPEITTDVATQTVNHHLMLDVARGAAQGREFWQTELQAGHARSGNAIEPRGLTRGPDPDPKEMELWNWNALMSGAKGILYWQYRPELLGHESPGFGLVRRDGEPTERTHVAERFASLTAENPEIEESEPLQADVAIGLLSEGAMFNYVAEKNTDQYSNTVRGAYQALWESNFNVDFAKPHQFDQYDVVYLPFPMLVETETAETIESYVRTGGTLIADGAPAVYDSNGRVFRKAPGNGLESVFGARLRTTRAAAGALDLAHGAIPACARRDVLEPQSAEAIGYWTDDDVGATRNEYGEGTAVILGTLAGAAYQNNELNSGASVVASLLANFDVSPVVRPTRDGVQARLHKFQEKYIAYLVNITEEDVTTQIRTEHDLGRPKETIGNISLADSEAATITLPARGGGAMYFSE